MISCEHLACDVFVIVLIILGFHQIIEHFLDIDDITGMFSDKYPILQTYFTNSSLEPSDERPKESADSLTCLSQVLHIKCLYCEVGCSMQPSMQADRDQGPITIIWYVFKMFVSSFIIIYELVYKLLGACRTVPFLCACQ
jgi:hypothetical protein